MADKSWHRHPILAGTVAGLLVALLLHVFGVINGVAILAACGAGLMAAWRWLLAASQAPNWLVLVLGAAALALGVVVAVTRRRGQQHLIPNELEAFGMLWRWDWRTDGSPGNPQPFCLKCDMQIVPTMDRGWRVGMFGAVIYHCLECGEDRHYAELSRDYIPTGPERMHHEIQHQVVLAAHREMRRAAQART